MTLATWTRDLKRVGEHEHVHHPTEQHDGCPETQDLHLEDKHISITQTCKKYISIMQSVPTDRATA